MALIDRFDHFLLDLDGAVYVGRELVPGSGEAIAELRRRGKQVRFITNDPTYHAEHFARRLERLGVPTSPSEVVSAAQAMLAYLEREEGSCQGLTAYVVGTAVLKEYLAQGGLQILEGTAAERAAVVIVGGHVDFNYEELKTGGRAARQAAHFVVSAPDAAFPMPDGPWPAAGAMAAGIGYMAGRQPVAVGKPEPWLFRAAAETLPPGGRVVVVGDNLQSDILGAQRAGYASVLVLSGHTDRHDLERSDIQPDYVLERLADILLSDASD